MYVWVSEGVGVKKKGTPTTTPSHTYAHPHPQVFHRLVSIVNPEDAPLLSYPMYSIRKRKNFIKQFRVGSSVLNMRFKDCAIVLNTDFLLTLLN